MNDRNLVDAAWSVVTEDKWAQFRSTNKLSDLDEAVEWLWGAVAVAADEGPDRARILSNLGAALSTRFERSGDLSDLDEAVEHFRDAMTVADVDGPDRARYLSNLGAALSVRYRVSGQLSDFDEAINLFESSATLSMTQAELATHLANLGALLQIRLDRWPGEPAQLADRVRSINEQTLEVRMRVLGEGHPDTLTSMNNLASSLLSSGDAAAARELFERVLADRARVLGEEHPASLSALRQSERVLLDAMSGKTVRSDTSPSEATSSSSMATEIGSSTAFSYRSSKGVLYYLHSKKVVLRGGKEQVIYYFAKDMRPADAVSRIPAGYEIQENDRNGFLTLKRSKS